MLRRVMQQKTMSWIKTLADALALRIADRNSSGAEHEASAAEPVLESPAAGREDGLCREMLEITRQILGQQAVLTYHSLDRLDRSLLLQGRIASLQLAARERVGCLAEVEFRVSS